MGSMLREESSAGRLDWEAMKSDPHQGKGRSTSVGRYVEDCKSETTIGQRIQQAALIIKYMHACT